MQNSYDDIAKFVLLYTCIICFYRKSACEFQPEYKLLDITGTFASILLRFDMSITNIMVPI